MTGMVQVAVLAIVAAICATVLRRGAGELVVPMVLGAGALILLSVAVELGEVLSTMSRLAQLAQLDDSLVAPVAKTVALAILTRITGELCRSAGEGGLAAFVEVAGTVLALCVALPLVEGVILLLVEIMP